MPVGNTPSVLPWPGDGATTVFGTPYFQAVNDLVVMFKVGVTTPVVLNYLTDYTLAGNGATLGGTVTIVNPIYIPTPANSSVLYVVSDPEVTQTASLPVGGLFPSADVQDVIDRAISILKSHDDAQLRTLAAAVTDHPELDMTLPSKESRAGMLLLFNAAGQPGVLDPNTIASGTAVAVTAATVSVDTSGPISQTTVQAALEALSTGFGDTTGIVQAATNAAQDALTRSLDSAASANVSTSIATAPQGTQVFDTNGTLLGYSALSAAADAAAYAAQTSYQRVSQTFTGNLTLAAGDVGATVIFNPTSGGTYTLTLPPNLFATAGKVSHIRVLHFGTGAGATATLQIVAQATSGTNPSFGNIGAVVKNEQNPIPAASASYDFAFTVSAAPTSGVLVIPLLTSWSVATDSTRAISAYSLTSGQTLTLIQDVQLKSYTGMDINLFQRVGFTGTSDTFRITLAKGVAAAVMAPLVFNNTLGIDLTATYGPQYTNAANQTAATQAVSLKTLAANTLGVAIAAFMKSADSIAIDRGTVRLNNSSTSGSVLGSRDFTTEIVTELLSSPGTYTYTGSQATNCYRSACAFGLKPGVASSAQNLFKAGGQDTLTGSQLRNGMLIELYGDGITAKITVEGAAA